MRMASTVFLLTIVIFTGAVILTVAVIAIALYFQKLRKAVEAEIDAATHPDGHEKVSKMTVKQRKKENKYSKTKKGTGELEPQYYSSPPLRDEHREIFQMKTFQRQMQNEDGFDGCLSQTPLREQNTQQTRHAETKLCPLMTDESYIECIAGNEDLQRMTPNVSGKSSWNHEPVTQAKHKNHALMTDESYIECIADNENLQRMTPNPSGKASWNCEPVTQAKNKSHATTMPRSFERVDINNAIRRVKPGASSSTSHGATLPIHTSSPINPGYKHGFKGTYRDATMPQQASRNTNLKNKDYHHEGEMYEVMENRNSEIYENTAFDPDEDFYGNQEIIEQESKRNSQTNMTQFPEHSRNRGPQTASYHNNNYEEEVYENQEIIDQEKRKSGQYHGTHHVELYENFNPETMYENC